MKTMKIAFIGGGNMGEAMLSTILEKELSTAGDISVGDIKEIRLNDLKDKYGVNVTTDNRQAVAKAEIIVMSIKPQNLPEVLGSLKGHLKSSQLVLSIIAGASIGTLSSGLEHKSIVRAMPNTPAQVGEGMTVWTATPEVTEQQKEQACAILGAMGQEIHVDNESYINMATAVSGSGPAYFFLFVEALVDAAASIGLPRDVARQLALQTMVGSGKLLQTSGKEPSELRRLVTSPGGTTAEALIQLNNAGFSDLIRRAVKAAYDKAIELGGGQSGEKP